MNKYLSLVFLYNRASHKKILLIAGVIPLGFLAIFLLRVGNPDEASPYMLMERGFGGIWAVLLFLAVNLMGLMAVVNSLNGKKALKATHATVGYTMRRLGLSPIASFITIFFYYLAMILIFWGLSIASLYAIGRIGLSMAGATGIGTRLALGLLRTEIGHALIPIAHPAVIVFDIVAVLALAGECARSCYFGWHNGRQSAGVTLVVAPMFLVWTYLSENSYILLAILLVAFYGAFAFGDVISREKRPKGDPFMVNKYIGIMDMDSTEFDENARLEVSSAAETYGTSQLQRYGRGTESDVGKGLKKLNPARLRRRFMPLGSNLERANFFFGVCICIGMAEHFLFFGRFLMRLDVINESIKGVTIDAAVKMPYFWDMQAHTYYGYIAAILLAVFLQAYWNYEYYNKETKSVYVMKRLPNRKEYPRTIWVAPAIQAFFIVIIMAAHTAVDLGVYVLGTPEIALHPDYLSHILPF